MSLKIVILNHNLGLVLFVHIFRNWSNVENSHMILCNTEQVICPVIPEIDNQCIKQSVCIVLNIFQKVSEYGIC